MKLNWGTGIAIFYGAFMVVMIAFVIKSKSVDHSLVTDDYYAEDIRYQSHMDKLSNSNALETDLEIKKLGDDQVQLQFPDLVDISGEVWFYKPNDSSKDFRVELKPDRNRQFLINTAKLTSGRWKLKVEWSAGNTDYYKETELYL